jgi:hypothetical protein
MIFSSFFSTIQNLLKSMVVGDSKNSNLEGLKLSNYYLQFKKLPESDIVLVTIADKIDEPDVKKFVIKFVKVLNRHSKLFLSEWDGEISKFDFLEPELDKVVSKFKNLRNK